MKIALYIEDGLEQLVLTPEGEHEKALLGKLGDPSRVMEIKRGSFFQCQGGWVRHAQAWRGSFDSHDRDDESTMIVLRKPAPAPAPPPHLIGPEDNLAESH